MSGLQQDTHEEIKKSEKLMALHDLTHGRAVYIMSFIVPLVIMIAIFIIRDIYPFGDNCYLRSDMYHQYCPFFSELWEKIRTGQSLYYSWDIGMGTNFLAVFGYYLSSPVNWFIALFPQKYMIEIMNVIILLKIAASGLTCTYYLCRHNNRRHLSAAVFGLFYALSAFIAAYSWNLMWLDCVVLLPLVVLGLEKLVKEGKGLLYTITLGLTILSNYYISIMVCLSMIIYFIVLIVSKPVPQDKSYYGKTIGRFVLYSLIAGGLAATLLLPEMCALEYTASGNINFPETLSRYFSFVTIFKRHLINTPVSIGLDHMPNIYCGVAVMVLFPLYIMTAKISRREKIMKVLALIAFLVAFNMNIPNFIWHGFHYPNSLPCRQSFIYIFLLLSICYDAVIHIREYKNSQIAGSFWGVMLFLLYIGNTIVDDDMDFRILYLSAGFIAVYVLMAFIVRNKKLRNDIVVVLLFVVSIIECTVNMDNTGYSTTSRSAYLKDYDSVSGLLDEISDMEDDNSFYRTTKYRGYRSKNDAAWHNFHGGSVFSSTAYASLTTFYGNMGLEHSTNAYAINGATPLVYSIFNIKYFLSNKEISGSELFSFVDIQDGEYLYVNNYFLPLGFMVPSDFNNNFLPDSNPNPFIIQNDFAKAAADIDDLFYRITFQDDSTSATIIPEQDEYLYMYIMNKSISSITVTVDGVSETYTGVNHGRMLDLGYVSKDSVINVANAEGGSESLQMYAYVLDMNKFTQLYDALADEGLEISQYDDTYIKGTVDVKSDGLLYTSIPYDEGYTVYVDGVETEYTSTGNNAFIALYLTEGSHTVEFEYFPRGLKSGRVLSIISLLLIAGCVFFRIRYKKEFTEDGAIAAIADARLRKNTDLDNIENNIENNTENNVATNRKDAEL